MQDSVDEVLAKLQARAPHWAARSASQRAELLRACLPQLEAGAAAWVADACRAKGIDFAAPLAGEEWMGGPAVTMRHLRLYAETLEGKPALKPQSENGRVRVFPSARFDRWFLPGFRAEIQLQAGHSATQTAAHNPQALGPGGVALVLGAGNISSIPPLDVLAMLLARNLVVVLKLNPINDYLLPHLQRALAPFLEAGYLTILTGDAVIGERLAQHPMVDHVHLTGSEQTYDALVWHPDPQRRAQAKLGTPRLAKPVTAELGAVTPVLVVPGAWSRADLDFQARQIAGMVAHNASFNCNAAKLVITARNWPQRTAFLQRLRAALAATPTRPAYYPGAALRWKTFAEHYSQAEILGVASDGHLPWLWIPQVQAGPDEYAFQTEAFCAVLAETCVEARTPTEFLELAVPLANQQVHGSLSCVVLAPDHLDRGALRLAVDGLHYGSVAVNTWAGTVYALGQTTWGAFPGHPVQEIQSGNGFVHNTWLLDHPAKCILQGPFRPWLKPVFMPGQKRLRSMGKNWTHFEAKPGWWRFARLAWAALRG
jgi:acyl-CoA reductase-like NAD-dependent aldehyde dehydrogenase